MVVFKAKVPKNQKFYNCKFLKKSYRKFFGLFCKNWNKVATSQKMKLCLNISYLYFIPQSCYKKMITFPQKRNLYAMYCICDFYDFPLHLAQL